MGACKFDIAGKEISAELSKIDRADLYGDTKTRVLGPGDEVLARAGVPENGRGFLTRADIKYAVVAGEDYTLRTVDVVDALDGKPLAKFASSFEIAPSFRPATADEVGQLEVASVYLLEGVKLDAGAKFIGSFNYREGYNRNDAAIVAKGDATFLLVGTLKKAAFIGLEVDSQLIATEEATETAENGESDFGSLF